MRPFILFLFLSSPCFSSPVSNLGAIECREEGFCRERCDLLRGGLAFCSVGNEYGENNGNTEITRTTHCQDWETICLTEELLIERGTPNPAYNWILKRVQDRCWLRLSNLSSETRRQCLGEKASIRVKGFPECDKGELVVEDDDYYLKPVVCGSSCDGLKEKVAPVSCSTEGNHSSAPPKEWGRIFVGQDRACIESRRVNTDFAQACFRLEPKPHIGRD